MDAWRIAIPAKFGLALLAAWPALTIGLSAVGERVALIQAVAILGLLPALLGAVTWLRAGQRSRKVFVRKRLFALASLALTLSVPLIHWPLRLSLFVARPALKRLATRVVPKMVEATVPSRGHLPIQLDLNPPVRCGLLTIETVGFEWRRYISLAGYTGDAELRFWTNRDGNGFEFIGDWRDPNGVHPPEPSCFPDSEPENTWQDKRNLSQKRRAWNVAPQIRDEFVVDTPTPKLLRQRN